jgi:hypothetical protein
MLIMKTITTLLTALLFFIPTVVTAKPNKKELICNNTKVPNKGANFFYRECARLAQDPKVSRTELNNFIRSHQARLADLQKLYDRERLERKVTEACNRDESKCDLN